MTTSADTADLGIEFSEVARGKLVEVIEGYPEEVAGLRLKIIGRTSHGFEHVLTIVERGYEPEDDAQVEYPDFRLYVDGERLEDLRGVKVHYEFKGPNVSGLEFDNPNPVWRDPHRPANPANLRRADQPPDRRARRLRPAARGAGQPRLHRDGRRLPGLRHGQRHPQTGRRGRRQRATPPNRRTGRHHRPRLRRQPLLQALQEVGARSLRRSVDQVGVALLQIRQKIRC